jgi:hypothetical protein
VRFFAITAGLWGQQGHKSFLLPEGRAPLFSKRMFFLFL